LNIKVNEDKTEAVYFSHGCKLVKAHLTLNGKNIPFVNQIKNLGVIFDRRITWRIHIKMIEAKAFTTFLRLYSLSKRE
jgi:hypothetical protein